MFQKGAAKNQYRLCSKAVVVKTAQPPLRAAADDPVDQLSPQLGVRTPEIEGREERRVKREPTAEEGTQD
jgi:hypothetical protein